MKNKRHNKIIELIQKYEICTQEELAQKLFENGYNVTQATISRDIRELNLFKVTADNGKQKYARVNNYSFDLSDKLISVFCSGVVSINYAQNIIVIKTLTGTAMAVAAALDAMNVEILGSIAGDDTIFCVVKNEEAAIYIIEYLNKIIKKF